MRETEVRAGAAALVGERIAKTMSGKLTMGVTNTDFRYGVPLNDAVVLNEDASVQLKVYFARRRRPAELPTSTPHTSRPPTIYWVVQPPERLDDRLRRVLAIGEARDRRGVQLRIATQQDERGGAQARNGGAPARVRTRAQTWTRSS